MSSSPTRLLIIGAAAIGFSVSAYAQFGPMYMKGESTALAQLGNSEGVYVEKGTFKLHLGKGDATPDQIARMGAKEVAYGAIIFRSGDKLYIVDWKRGE